MPDGLQPPSDLVSPARRGPPSDLVTVGAAKAPPADLVAPAPPSSLLKDAALAIPRAIGKEAGEAWESLKQDWRDSHKDADPGAGFWDRQKAEFDRFVATGKTALDAFRLVTSPITGATEAVVVKPVAKGMAAISPKLPGETDEQRQASAERAVSGALFAARPGKVSVKAGAPKVESHTITPSVKEPPPDLAPAHPTEGPLTRPPALEKPREMEDQLFQLRNLETADRLDALQAVQKLPEDYTPELDEKLYHHEENPAGLPLAAREKAIYDEHVAPIRQEANALGAELEKITGVKADLNDIYTPRYVAGRTRSYGEAIAQFMKGVETRFGGAATRTMRKTVDAQKGRDFFIAEHPETGDRVLVYVAPDRNVLAFDGTPQPKPFGRLAGSTGPRSGAIVKSESGAYRLAHATTREIEAQAQTRYIKSVMANRLDNLAKLRSAVRNAKYLEDLKSDPAFPDFFKEAANTPVPPVTNGRQWRRPSLPQFQGYYVEPRIADAFDDFARSGNNVEGIAAAFNAIGRAMNAVMFLNPKAHIDNVFNHMLIGRGLVGNVMSARSTVRNLVRGAREVWTLGPEYRRALKAGLSLPYARIVAGDLHPMLLKRLGADAAANPRAWDRLARGTFGYPSAKIMLKRWGAVSNRVLWGVGDAMMMSRVMQLKEMGIPIERAIRKAESEIPNYRVPGQIITRGKAGRALSRLFGNPVTGRFGRYQFAKLDLFMRSLREAFGTSAHIGERGHAFDQLAMFAFYSYIVYGMYDWLWQQVTGNPLAHTIRSGVSSIFGAAQDVATGRRKIGDVITSFFSLGVPIELGSELYTGRYGFSGQPIVRDADVRAALDGDETRMHQVARDVTAFVARQLSTIGQMVNPSATDTVGQSGLRALGVISPTEEQERAREKAQRLDERSARRRAQKQENR